MANVASAQNDWAIVVGIKQYPELGDLNGPENDARAFYDWVTAPTGGGVPQTQAQLLLSSNFPTAALTREALPSDREVEGMFERLDDLADQNQKDGNGLQVGRRLYLYFSGHGCAPKFEESAILMANATRRRVYHVPGKPWADWFYRAGYFREIALFMDCCREPYENVVLNVPHWIDLTLPDIVDKSRRFYGFGTKWSRLSREKEYPAGSGIYRGVFTLALLDGFQGAAYDASTVVPNPTGGLQAFVTAASLGNYLRNNMKNYLTAEDLSDPDIEKEPDLVYDAGEGQAFRFNLVDVPCFPVQIECPTAQPGQVLQIRGEGFQVVYEQPVNPPSVVVPLQRGHYEARIKGTGAEALFLVTGMTGVDHVVHI